MAIRTALSLALAASLALLQPATAQNSGGFFGSGGSTPHQRRAQIELLQRIRASDPNRQTIVKAVFDRENELGIVFGRRVPMDSVPTLMKTLLAQMAKAFPGQNLTIIAYAPSNPPLKIGAARLDARTRAMSFEHAR